MFTRFGKKQTLVALMLATIFVFSPAVQSLGDEYKSGQSIEEKIAELEGQLSGLTALVKSLSLQMQEVSHDTTYDLGDFQPRLHTIEKISKENAFSVKILSGSVGELVGAVDALSELPAKVYEAKNNLKELHYYFEEAAEGYDAKIQNSELVVKELHTALERTQIVLETLFANFEPLNMRLEENEAYIQNLAAQADAIHGGFEQVASNASRGLTGLGNHADELSARISQLESAMQQAQQVSEFASRISVEITQIVTRIDETESANVEIFEFFEQFARFEGRVGDLHNQIEQVGSQLLVLSRQAEENSGQINANADRIESLMRMASGDSGDESAAEGRLSQKIQEAFIQFEGTQQSIDQLRASFATAQDDIKRDVLRSLPRTPSTDEILMLIQESAELQVREADARAAQAQSIAMIALLTGLSAIAVSLLL
jgi:chromosome segregation ATPase